MSKKKSTLNKLYTYNKRTNSYEIDIALNKYEEIYNEWDTTPFRRRDIEEEFIDYVVDSSLDIPMRYGIELNLYFPKDKEDSTKERNVKAAIKSYFNYLIDRNKRSLMKSVIRCIRSLVIGLILLGFCYLSSSVSYEEYFGRVFIEGICILGWVALWDVGEQFLFVWISKFNKLRVLKRLANAKVEFIYK